MNKTLMLAAFAVLLTGFAFAITGVDTVTVGTDTKWSSAAADSDLTEGGNVTELNLSGNVSTEKWAGYFGDLVGNIVLAQALDTAYLFNWTWDGDNATVCASTASAYTWASVVGGAAADITTPWTDTATGSDSAANTFDSTVQHTVYVNGGALTGDTANTNGDYFTVVVNDGATAAKDDLAFCVGAGADYGTNNYKGTASNYEMIVPTDNGPTDYETYYFYFELH